MEINIHLLHYELQQVGLPIVCVSSDGHLDYARDLNGQEQIVADAVVAAHDPEGDLPWNLNKKEAEARFLLSQLADKTPEEIYVLMQDRMDGWQNLSQAKSDLREWLPLMAAVIAWKVID